MAFANIPTNFDAGSSLRDALAQAPERNQQLFGQGLQTGQQAATLNALAGININDPNSVNQGIANLVKHGAMDQAGALISLGITRQIAPRIPGILDSIGGLGSQSSAASAQPSAPAAQQPGQPNAQGAADNMAFAAQSAQQLLAADPADRPALAAQIKQAALARGIPEPAIDANLSDLSTPGLQATAAQLQSHADHMTVSVSGLAQGATVPPLAAGGYPWAQQLLNNPGQQAGLDVLKHFGYDLTGLTDTAKAIQAPTIAKQAELANARGIASETGAGQAEQDLATVTLPDNSTAQMPRSQALMLGAHGALHSMDPISLAAKTTAAQAQATAANTPQTVNVNGVPTVVTMDRDANGNLTAKEVQAPSGGGGLHGLSPGETTNQTTDAANLGTAVAAIPGRLAGYPAALAKGQAILGLADTVGTSAYTPKLQAIAQYLPGPYQKYAAQAGLLGQDLKGEFQAALGGLAVPRVAVEAKSIIGQIPTNASTPDQIKTFAAGLMAATQYNQRHDEFLQNWQAQSATDPTGHPPSLAAANAAWQAGPGRASLFTMPAYQGITVGGKPAVVPFTNRAGQSRMAVLPGLLKTPIIVPGS